MLDLAAIQNIIPHRAPILMVDKVLSFTAGEKIIAERFLPKNDPVFAGHFPGHPIMPGVLGVEALAQTSALLINLTVNKTADETLFYFMGIDKVKFKNPIHPEDTLTYTVKQEKRLGDIFRFSGTVSKKEGDKEITCTEGIFTAKLLIK